MSKDQLAKSTLEAEKAEQERRERLQEKQKKFNGIEMIQDSESGQFLFQLTGNFFFNFNFLLKIL